MLLPGTSRSVARRRREGAPASARAADRRAASVEAWVVVSEAAVFARASAADAPGGGPGPSTSVPVAPMGSLSLQALACVLEGPWPARTRALRALPNRRACKERASSAGPPDHQAAKARTKTSTKLASGRVRDAIRAGGTGVSRSTGGRARVGRVKISSFFCEVRRCSLFVARQRHARAPQCTRSGGPGRAKHQVGRRRRGRRGKGA